MNANLINQYLHRAREIVGERSAGEIAYDDTVVAHLAYRKDIQQAIRSANEEHPKEALRPRPEDWPDLTARYEYLAEHQAILLRLGVRE